MIDVTPAARAEMDWCREMVARHHYLRKPPDPRSRPFCHVVRLAGEPVGCLWWGRPESTRCYVGTLTYGSVADVNGGRAVFDRWEVLNLARVWLSPDVQAGGRLCEPGRVPGFTDRRGVWRPTAASAVIRAALGRVGFDYLNTHPPVFVDQPYRIRAVLSYCDTRHHRGTIYREAGFRFGRENGEGKQTWWTPAVADLTAEQDATVRQRAGTSLRSQQIRNRARTLFADLQPSEVAP